MTAVAPTTTPIDPDRTIPTLLLAFSADPVVRWLSPGTGPYHAVFGAFVRLAAGDAFTAVTVDVAYGSAGVAVWARPGAAVDDDGYTELFCHHIDPTPQADVLAYLESGNPRNRSLFEHHGFEVVAEIKVPDSPPLWPMLREPRS